MKQYQCPIKPLLSPQNRVQRYRWAQNHVFWDQARFQQVVWTDESRFRLFSNNGQIRVWRQRGESYRDDLIQRRTQGGGGSVHVWGGVWHGGRSELQILVRAVNGQQYCNILTTFLDGQQLPAGLWMLQQDNAPAHRCALVHGFLQDRHVRVMPWPSKSPDLNPIENVWDHIGRRVHAQHPQNLRQLADVIQQEWLLIPQEYLDTLVSSMHPRITAVLQAMVAVLGIKPSLFTLCKQSFFKPFGALT